MHNKERRNWLRLCLTVPAMPLLARLRGAHAQASMQRQRIIPASGERIAVMGLGTSRVFDVGRDENVLYPLRQVMRLFVERGGSMVDSSPMYGQAERVVGDLASSLGIVDRIFVATKVWTQGAEAGREQMENSFRLLRTQRINLMQVHNLVDTQTQLASIRSLIDAGRIQYIGITHYTARAFDDLESWIKKEKLDYVQFPYSIVNRQAEKRLLSIAADHGVATIAHRNFERGRLFAKVKGKPLPEWAKEFDCDSWGNYFLKYVIADPRITNVIPATRRSKHLLDNMNAGIGRLPDQTQRKNMVAYFENL